MALLTFSAPQHWKLTDLQNLLWLSRIEEILKRESWRMESEKLESRDLLFQPSPSSQELGASATQGHSVQDTGMFFIDLCLKQPDVCLSISTWDMNWMSRIKSWTDILWGREGSLFKIAFSSSFLLKRLSVCSSDVWCSCTIRGYVYTTAVYIYVLSL